MRIVKDTLLSGRRWLRDKGLSISRIATGKSEFSGIAFEWGAPGSTLRGEIAEVSGCGLDARFFVVDPRDEIQRHHRHGTFYETDVVEELAQLLGEGAYLDIGANVGNHMVFMGKFRPGHQMIGVEANPFTYRLLTYNIALNDLSSSTLLLPYALGSETGTARMNAPEHNLGAARIADDGGIVVELRRGDDLLPDARISLVKIDTEGFELEVLSGLAKTLRTHRPVIFCEVEHPNRAQFDHLMDELGYHEDHRLTGRIPSQNRLMLPEKP